MVRWLGSAVLGMVWLTVGASAAGAAGAAEAAWLGGCSDQGAERRCSVSIIQGYTNNRGERSDVTVSIVRDAACATLLVGFDGPIAPDRPARLALDDGPDLSVQREPRRLGLACAPMAQLMTARVLRIGFSAEPRNRTRVYHWVGLTERSVEVSLEGLRAALDRVSAQR